MYVYIYIYEVVLGDIQKASHQHPAHKASHEHPPKQYLGNPPPLELPSLNTDFY